MVTAKAAKSWSKILNESHAIIFLIFAIICPYSTNHGIVKVYIKLQATLGSWWFWLI